MPPFTGDATFTVAAGPTALPQPATSSVLRYSIHDMYLGQPGILDTLVPAAVAGQAFIATVPVSNDTTGTLGLLALPAYPRPDGTVVLDADPTRVFIMNGTFSGDAVKASGQTTLAAMGAEIPFDPLRMSCRLTAQGIVGGQIHATAPLLEIKGNGTTYTGLSWSAMFDLADPSLQLQAFGSFGGDLLAAPAVPVTLTQTSWSGSTLDVTVSRVAASTDDHIITALLVDDAQGSIVGEASALLPAGAASQPASLVLQGLDPKVAAQTGVALRFYFDGEPLP